MKWMIALWLVTSTLISQAQQITGFVKDENGAPLSGATVNLVKANDSSTVKLAITKVNGSYVFSGINGGSYNVMATYIGFKPAFSPAFSFGTTDMTMPELKLVKMTGNLANVTIVANKPIVEVKADKMILNVEGTINAVGSNALELLRKSPGVLLDQDDNISLAGKNGVQIYIDGRATPLSGADLANYLKTLQSSQIEAIELITNPSAKYDAAGNAGIINIRLKKNKSLGTNGSVNAGWNIGITAKYNAGASLNYRNKNINLFSTYSFNYGPTEQKMDVTRTVLDSLFDQRGTIRQLGRAHNFKAGADYFINKKSTIGVMLNGTLADPEFSNYSKTYISNSTTNTVDRILIADNSNDLKRHNLNVNLNYSYIDPAGTSLVVNADHGTYDLNSDQFQPNYYYDPSGQVMLNRVIYHMYSPAKININTAKADYEQNFKKGKLSLGVKTAWVKTDNNFQRFNVTNAIEDLDKDRSNRFVYRENINAGYINYNRQYKTVMIQAGLRAEYTVSEGVSEGLKWNGGNYVPSITSFKRSYTSLFPSAAITFNKNPMKQWSLTYSRRIDRPAYQDLNPFEFKMDEYTYMKGNVNLRPQYTNSFGVTHTYKYKLNISLNYSHVNDLFTQIVDTTEKSKAFVSKKNLATQDIASISISYPFQYKSYSLFTSISSNYSKYKADFGTGRKVDLAAFGFSLFAQNSLKFAKTWTAELSGFFNAPTIYQGSFKGKSIYNIDAGISKQVFKGKGTIKAAVSDVFHTMRFRATSDFAGQIMKINFLAETRQFKLSVNYRFGNNGVKPPKQRTGGAEEELKRAQQSGGVIGN
ncbi:MAG: TonB-dependent receptor [Sphingobacteriales bacterium]|nr:TonB-dependent receptor [Sphingobacteriales bacterium]